MSEQPTKLRIAVAFREVAAKANPNNAPQYEALAVRAETGAFDDFCTVHDCGPTALYHELKRHGFHKLAARVGDGEFDASREESGAWANSPEGRDAMKDFTAEDRAILFGVFDA